MNESSVGHCRRDFGFVLLDLPECPFIIIIHAEKLHKSLIARLCFSEAIAMLFFIELSDSLCPELNLTLLKVVTAHV